MFTLTQIGDTHKKVKSGADFPAYARELSEMWVTAYDTFVSDGHAIYLGNPEPIISPAKYETLTVAKIVNTEKFLTQLKLHQSGGTNYMTFCQDCAANGVEKWTLDLIAKTCTYYDRTGNEMIVEHFGE
jgi:uncharacterized protein YbcV (DUF1398 family)